MEQSSEELTVAEPVKNIPASNGTQKFIIIFTRALHRTLAGTVIALVSRCNVWRSEFFQWLFQSIQGPGLLFSFVIFFTQMVGLVGRVISSSQGLYLYTRQHKHRINAYTHQTSMPWTGFKPTIPASEWAKTVHALDRTATVTVVT
jgi:hypothetical protein